MGESDDWREVIGYSEQGAGDDSIDRFLMLPQQDVPVHEPLPPGREPQIDFSKSYILTFEEYMASLEAKAFRKQALQEEARLSKVAADASKENHRLEMVQKEAKSKARAEERAANKSYNDYWEKVKRDGWGDSLHALIKANRRNPSLNLRTPKNLAVPSICRYNQKIAMLRAQFKREGKDPRLVVPAMNVQQCMSNPRWSAHGGQEMGNLPW
jgi:hypothetical protein